MAQGARLELPDPRKDQKAFLVAAKEALRPSDRRLTWDRFAELLGIEPRALKTYKAPADSSDYRSMPRLLIEKIEHLAGVSYVVDFDEDPRGGDAQGAEWRSRRELLKLLPTALAALVLRQARHVFGGGGATMVSGVSRIYPSSSGLVDEDRRAMALVSRARLSLGLSDVGAEIHELLAHCTKPFEEWLPIDVVAEDGLGKVRLIDPDDRDPTLEAEELAAGFGGMTSLLEEYAFAAFKDALDKQPQGLGYDYYSTVRSFVIRNPVVSRSRLLRLLNDQQLPLPTAVFACVEQFYEPLPRGLLLNGDRVRLCAHCGNVMQEYLGGLRCLTRSCAAVDGANPGDPVIASELLRLNRSIRKYWLEPGIDEIRLADQLTLAGHSVRLYPRRDVVDIDLGDRSEVGIDLKAYSSPELLGERMKQRPGGLLQYRKKLLVVPDWIARREENYLSRLAACLEGTSIRALTLSDAVKDLGYA